MTIDLIAEICVFILISASIPIMTLTLRRYLSPREERHEDVRPRIPHLRLLTPPPHENRSRGPRDAA